MKQACSECELKNGGNEFNCAFSTFDAREYVPIAESRWVATFASGRAIPFELGASVNEAFARRYAQGRLVATMNAWTDGDVVSVAREER